MKKKTKAAAVCGITAALCIVILLLGNAVGIGTYAAPLLAGIGIIPVGRKYGIKYHLSVWLISGILALILLSDVEESLIYLCLFGWYPAIKPFFDRLRKGLRLIIKLAVFNVLIIALEILIMSVLVPEAESTLILLVLLAAGNITFLLYDLAIPKITNLMEKRILKYL